MHSKCLKIGVVKMHPLLYFVFSSNCLKLFCNCHFSNKDLFFRAKLPPLQSIEQKRKILDFSWRHFKSATKAIRHQEITYETEKT